MADVPIAYTTEGRPLYDNTATVVAVAIEYRGKVLAIRRNTEPGKGKLALPGGFQMRGETWQQAGAREVFEEIGMEIASRNLDLMFMETDEYDHNVAVAHYLLKDKGSDLISCLKFNQDEVQEIVWIDYDNLHAPDWAFNLHYQGVEDIIMERWK